MKIAVVGDLMVDHSILVKAKKLCTEAPIPVFEEVGEEWSLGGAAGVAMMCKALGADVLLCGVTDRNSKAGYEISNQCDAADIERGYIYEGVTTVKKRYYDTRDGQRQLVARFDRDCSYQCTGADAELFFHDIKDFEPDSVIIQDHGKGVVNERLVSLVCKEFATFIDPIDATPIPNSWGKHLVVVGGDDEIPDNTEADFFVVKKGSLGINCSSVAESFDIPAYCKRPVNTCGAGDSFVSALVVARLQGMDWKDSCIVASKAAAIYVGRHGFEPVTPEEVAAWTPS